MKYQFKLNQKKYVIEIPDNATFHSPTPAKVNRDIHSIFLGEADDGDTHSLFLDNRLYQIEVEKDATGYPTGIYVNGDYFPSRLIKIDRFFYTREKPLESTRSGVVKSSMPGFIKEIFHRSPQKVQENDIILIQEAMKMENEIRAPKTGIISFMGVEEGDNIPVNHVLFKIE